MLTAAELHRRGVDAINVGQLRRARRLLESAMSRSDSRELTARVAASLAFAEAELGDPQAALARCAEAVRLPGVSPATRAIVRCQYAMVLLWSGDVDAALAQWDLGVPGLPADTIDRGNALLNRGLALMDRADYPRAAQDFAAAAAAFAGTGDELARAHADHNRGYVAMRQGELVDALRLMEQAADPIEASGALARAIARQDRAAVLLTAGMEHEGVRQLQAALASFAGLRAPRLHAECEFSLGRALLLSDPRRARVLARSAARRFRRLGNTAGTLRAEALEAIAQATGGRRTRAWLDAADRLATALRDQAMAHEAQLLDLTAARVAVSVGDLPDAASRLRRGRTDPRDSLTERLLECQAKADLEVARGRPGRALAHVHDGLELLHDWQSSFGSLDLISSVVGHGRGLAVAGLRLALADGSAELVFEWSERARALTTRVVPVRPPRDEQMAADLVEIRTLTVTEPDAGSTRADRLAELRERVRRHAWLGRGSGEVSGVAALAEVLTAIGDDTALVSYVWDGSARLHALVVTSQRQSVVDLGPVARLTALLGGLRADLDVSASDLAEAMARVVIDGRDRRLAAVAEALVAPLLPMLGRRRVVITQAGLLSGIPWSMLPGFVGRPITVASAATRWLATRDLAAPERIGLVAGPDVARAGEEVKQSAQPWPSAVVLTDDAASVSSVLDLAGQVDVLHVSAHGAHTAEHPLFSGVLLDDGPLCGYDLDQLKRVPDSVILSACELGRSTQRWAEESLGMVNAWLHAGARCVIASPAAVGDDEACELLQDVHRLMAGGAPPGVALAEATRDRPTSFVCFGAGW